jgi:hypothetical protein
MARQMVGGHRVHSGARSSKMSVAVYSTCLLRRRVVLTFDPIGRSRSRSFRDGSQTAVVDGAVASKVAVSVPFFKRFRL